MQHISDVASLKYSVVGEKEMWAFRGRHTTVKSLCCSCYILSPQAVNLSHNKSICMSMFVRAKLITHVQFGMHPSINGGRDGDCYTEAQFEAMVMCGNNHWIIKPSLTRSIQIDL